jgi:KTSC domain
MMSSTLSHVFQSRHLNTGQYDEETQVLSLQFYNGAVYNYYGVPRTTVDKLFQTGSSQEYFNDHIRDRYSYRKMADGVSRATGRRSRSKRF